MQEKGSHMPTPSKPQKPLSPSAEAPDSPFLSSSGAAPASTSIGPSSPLFNRLSGDTTQLASKSFAVRQDYRPARSVPATSRQFSDLLEAITERLSRSLYEGDRSLGHTLSETLRFYDPQLLGPHEEIISSYDKAELEEKARPGAYLED